MQGGEYVMNKLHFLPHWRIVERLYGKCENKGVYQVSVVEDLCVLEVSPWDDRNYIQEKRNLKQKLWDPLNSCKGREELRENSRVKEVIGSHSGSFNSLNFQFLVLFIAQVLKSKLNTASREGLWKKSKDSLDEVLLKAEIVQNYNQIVQN